MVKQGLEPREAKSTHPNSGVRGGLTAFIKTISTHSFAEQLLCTFDSRNTKTVSFELYIHIEVYVDTLKQILTPCDNFCNRGINQINVN